MLCINPRKSANQDNAPEAKRASTDSDGENCDEVDPPEPVTGAMDGFLDNSKGLGSKTKKTKKKLVEKTFMDPKGYFGECRATRGGSLVRHYVLIASILLS